MILYWNDPDPLEGNDYEVTNLEKIGYEMYSITYNKGASEAEVDIEELEFIYKPK